MTPFNNYATMVYWRAQAVGGGNVRAIDKGAFIMNGTKLRHYPCRGFGCNKPSVYFAIGNTPRFGHLCEECWKAQTPAEQSSYEYCALPLQVINQERS